MTDIIPIAASSQVGNLSTLYCVFLLHVPNAKHPKWNSNAHFFAVENNGEVCLMSSLSFIPFTTKYFITSLTNNQIIDESWLKFYKTISPFVSTCAIYFSNLRMYMDFFKVFYLETMCEIIFC